MFCKNCGAKVLESGFCQNCNTSSPEIKSDNNGVFYKNTVLDNGTDKASVDRIDLKGLGGWLIIVCIGLIYNLVTSVMTIYSDGVMFMDGTVEKVSVIQGYAGVLGFELLAFIILTILIIYLLFLFFKKKKSFPRFYIYFLVTAVVVTLIDVGILNSLNYPTNEIKQAMQSVISDGFTNLGKSFIFALIWGAYMKKSERVKLTFVE